MATYNNIKKIKIGDNIFNLYDSGNSGGTVTQVTAGTGLSIGTTAGGNFTTSGTINHTNSVTAQTTQAVYPIKIDAQGHISAYGSAVTIPSAYSLPLAASGTRGGVQIGYSESGTNYAVKLSSEKMYVSVPWTDTKVTVAENTKTTKYYPILATGTGTATRQIDTNDKNDSSATASGFWYENGILCAPAMQAGDWDLTITTAEYNTLVNAISAI